MIKKITSNEFNNVKELVKKVFDNSVAKDYSDDGKEEFYKLKRLQKLQLKKKLGLF